MYLDAVRPWTKRFSDVDERWGGAGGEGVVEEEGRVIEEGVEEEEEGGEEGGGRPRALSIEDVRSQYVFGQLPSLALEEGEEPGEGGGEKAREVEVIRKEDFLMKLAVALLSYGCPIPRIEYSMQGEEGREEGREGRKGGGVLYGRLILISSFLPVEISDEGSSQADPRIHIPTPPFLLLVLLKTLGVEGSFSILPSMMFITFGVPISPNTETHILRVGGGLDVYKLRRVNHWGKEGGREGVGGRGRREDHIPRIHSTIQSRER